MNDGYFVQEYLERQKKMRDNETKEAVLILAASTGILLVAAPFALAYWIAELPVSIMLAATRMTNPFASEEDRMHHWDVTAKVTNGLLIAGAGAAAATYLVGPATVASTATALYSAAAAGIMQGIAAVGATAAVGSAVAAAPIILTGVGVLIAGGILATGVAMAVNAVRE